MRNNTVQKRYLGLKTNQLRDIGIIASCGINAFAIYMYTNQFIMTHDFRTPIQIKFEFKTQAPIVEKKYKIVSPKPLSFAMKAYAAEDDKGYLESEEYKNSNQTWKNFVKAAYKLAPIYDYPVKVLLSQGALESGHGTSRMALTRNNFFGYNCNDGHEEEDCFYFATPEEGIIEYMRLIKRYPIYSEAYAARTNPEEMIAYIKAAGYATDPNYVPKVMSMDVWRLMK